MESNKYTVTFATVICVLLSILLSVTYVSLKDRQDLNRKIDQQKNILIAAGIEVESNDKVVSTFNKSVDSLYLDRKGNIVKNDLDNQVNHLPIYKIVVDGKVSSYVYPAQGVGLWSTLYGYVAVKPNGSTIVGLTFYKEAETPGLGAEITKSWFRDNFVNKEICKGDKVVGITVVKGKARDHVNYKSDKEHMVDGISGATITGNGVTSMMKRYPIKYAPFFKKIQLNKG